MRWGEVPGGCRDKFLAEATQVAQVERRIFITMPRPSLLSQCSTASGPGVVCGQSASSGVKSSPGQLAIQAPSQPAQPQARSRMHGAQRLLELEGNLLVCQAFKVGQL